MIDINEKKVVCDLKNFCFLCKENPILENPTGEQMFYHCISCGIDFLCDTAIARQFDKRTKQLKEICPKCRGKLIQVHYPLKDNELENLR